MEAFNDEDPISVFNSEVAAKMKGGLSRDAAIAAVAVRNPDLHREFLLATNAGRPAAQALIESRCR
jgi:hypothetical protein